MESQNPNVRTNILHHLIFHEVLPKIPAISLLRFKSVSPEWNSFISSVDFAKTHALFHSHRSSSSVLTADNFPFLPFEAIEFDANLFLGLRRSRYGINIKGAYILLSSCNGLVFLISCDRHDQAKLGYRLHLLDFCYVVYNPVLGANHFIEIPHPNAEFPLGDHLNHNYQFGFGYVSSTDDYYIVAIHSAHNSMMTALEYSLRSQQWSFCTKDIAMKQEGLQKMGFRNLWCYNEIATLVGETLHWAIMLDDRYHCILAYDLAVQEDKIRLMHLPRFVFGYYFGLCCLNGCLCAWARHQDPTAIDMWMMKEYGVRRSWTLMFRYLSETYVCRKLICSIKPRMVLVVANQYQLILADFSRRPPIVWNPLVVGKSDAVAYVPTLVSVFIALISVPRE